MAQHSPGIRTPKQLIVLILLAFLVPILTILLITRFVTGGMKADRSDPTMSDEAIAKRLQPIAMVVFKEEGQADKVAKSGKAAESEAEPAPAKSAEAPKAESTQPADGDKPKPTAGKIDGKAIYEKVCAACHATGVAQAPKTGDKETWAPRLKEGIETLYANAIKGKGAMPPKGGATNLSDAEVKAAVDYLLATVK